MGWGREQWDGEWHTGTGKRTPGYIDGSQCMGTGIRAGRGGGSGIMPWDEGQCRRWHWSGHCTAPVLQRDSPTPNSCSPLTAPAGDSGGPPGPAPRPWTQSRNQRNSKTGFIKGIGENTTTQAPVFSVRAPALSL